MSFGLFLLCVGTLATGVFVFTAFLYMRSQARNSVGSEERAEVFNEINRIQKAEVPVNETKIDIKIIEGNITLTTRDIGAENLERIIENLNAKQIYIRKVNSVNEKVEGESDIAVAHERTQPYS